MLFSLRERFMDKFIKGGPDECWLWQACVDTAGYGRIGDRDNILKAHRLAWLFENGKIPKGMYVLHTCDTPGCVNPKHLFLGTYQDNSDDMMKKGRGATGEKSYTAVLTEDDVKEIRLLYCPFIVTQQKLADRFGVDQSVISRIINRQRWQHI